MLTKSKLDSPIGSISKIKESSSDYRPTSNGILLNHSMRNGASKRDQSSSVRLNPKQFSKVRKRNSVIGHHHHHHHHHHGHHNHDNHRDNSVSPAVETVLLSNGRVPGCNNNNPSTTIRFDEEVTAAEAAAAPRPHDSIRSKSGSSFERFCNCTSLHGWKYLSSNVNTTLRIGWVAVLLAAMGVAAFFLGYSCNDFLSSTVQTTQDTSRASLDNVYFPSVTLCNINQGRRSFFVAKGLSHESPLLGAVLSQAYFGSRKNLTQETMSKLKDLFSSEDVVKKGLLADLMYMTSASKDDSKSMLNPDDWVASKDYDFVSEAGWYFKTLAAQEPGEDSVLDATYGRRQKNVSTSTHLLPFFGTDYGLCSLIKPQITFNESLNHLPFATLMTNYSSTIGPGIQLGKENGLTLLLDAEVYDYAFSPQKGEGFKLAIHSHMDQPIMALSDIDLSPGFVTQLSVTPVLRDTTEQAKWRFNPEERGCYFDGELVFKYLPSSLYRYSLTNCLFAATYDQVLEQCKCVPFFHTMAYDDYPRICSGTQLLCMNMILRDIGSHTHVRTMDDQGNVVWKPCLFSCKDQTFTTAVTTSTFPNMHTFLSGPEFCFMVRKLFSSCGTNKNLTLEEQYPSMCYYLSLFPQLCELPRPATAASVNKSSSANEPLTQEHLMNSPDESKADVLQMLLSTSNETLRSKGFKLIRLLHKYARENLLLANIYIKDPAVTMIRRDQKIPVIWFVANIGGILGLCMGCSLVTIFEVLHHVILIFLRTSVNSVTRIHQTIRCAPREATTPSGLTMAAFMQLGSNMNIFAPITPQSATGGTTNEAMNGILTPTKAALLLRNRHPLQKDTISVNSQPENNLISSSNAATAEPAERRGSF